MDSQYLVNSALTPDTHSKSGQHGPEDKLFMLVFCLACIIITADRTPVYTSAAASKRPAQEKAPEKTAPISLFFLHNDQMLVKQLGQVDVLFLEDGVGYGLVAGTRDATDQNVVVNIYIRTGRLSTSGAVERTREIHLGRP